MDSIVQMLLQFQISIKILHWQTTSYATHIATDSLYKNLSANIDKFVEVMQGAQSGRVKFAKNSDLELLNFDKKGGLNLLKFIRSWLETSLPKFLNKSDTDLFNIRDEMLSDINQTIYLFSLN
jgi:hypothetical protein